MNKAVLGGRGIGGGDDEKPQVRRRVFFASEEGERRSGGVEKRDRGGVEYSMTVRSEKRGDADERVG